MEELDTLPRLLLIGNSYKEVLGGREYIVRKAVILQEGILNGSNGPLYYPLNEVMANVGIWNGIPATAPHPMKTLPDGRTVPVSARSPDIAKSHQVGTVYNDRIENGRRIVDVWFDIKNCDRIDNRIVPALLRNDPVNVSTGIFSDRRPADPTTNRWNGQTYTHSVHNMRADHLAILMDEDGACSVRDGCGINLATNSFSNLSGHTMNKSEKIDWLTANCDCWKGQGSKTTLNSLDEQTLDKLKLNAEKASRLDLTVNALKEISQTVKAPADVTLADLPDLVKNAMSGKSDSNATKDAKGKSGPGKKNGYEGQYDKDTETEEERDAGKKTKVTANSYEGLLNGLKELISNAAMPVTATGSNSGAGA